MFKKRHTFKEVEEGKFLSPKFDKNGLSPVITTDFKNGIWDLFTKAPIIIETSAQGAGHTKHTVPYVSCTRRYRDASLEPPANRRLCPAYNRRCVYGRAGISEDICRTFATSVYTGHS